MSKSFNDVTHETISQMSYSRLLEYIGDWSNVCYGFLYVWDVYIENKEFFPEQEREVLTILQELRNLVFIAQNPYNQITALSNQELQRLAGKFLNLANQLDFLEGQRVVEFPAYK